MIAKLNSKGAAAMSDDLNVEIDYQVQGTAYWRRQKAEQFPDDERNIEAAEELDRLAIEIEALEGSELHRQINEVHDSINRLPDQHSTKCWEDIGEAVSGELRAIGFHTSHSTGVEFLKWYRDLLRDNLQDQVEKANPAPSLDEQVANDPAVAAARRAYEEAYAKALAEARNKL
jgi:hypothetical protein